MNKPALHQISVLFQAFLFAPDDVPQLLANPKNNLFGIGYSGLEKPAMFGGSGGGHRLHMYTMLAYVESCVGMPSRADAGEG